VARAKMEDGDVEERRGAEEEQALTRTPVATLAGSREKKKTGLDRVEKKGEYMGGGHRKHQAGADGCRA